MFNVKNNTSKNLAFHCKNFNKNQLFNHHRTSLNYFNECSICSICNSGRTNIKNIGMMHHEYTFLLDLHINFKT